VPRRGEGQHAAVNLLILVAVATALGFLVIILVGRGQPVSPAASAADGEASREGGEAEISWVRAQGLAGLDRLLRALFAEMGFQPEGGEAGREAVEFRAVDPTPIRGGRIHVRGLLCAPGERVGADEVRMLVDAARADFAGKAVLVTLGRFSDEAAEAARDAPIDLVDGLALGALVKKHLPQRYATRAT
jgi:hypothetical protein